MAAVLLAIAERTARLQGGAEAAERAGGRSR